MAYAVERGYGTGRQFIGCKFSSPRDVEWESPATAIEHQKNNGAVRILKCNVLQAALVKRIRRDTVRARLQEFASVPERRKVHSACYLSG